MTSAMEVLSSCVRAMIAAPEGKKLVVADLANIEGRVLAWLAGEEWKLQAFRDYDAGTGPDLYKLAYSRAFNVPMDAVTKDERAVGKVMELALGFAGGAGAFSTMAAAYNVKLSDAAVAACVSGWRSTHPNVRKLWYGAEKAAIKAIENEGTSYEVRGLRFRCASRNQYRWLTMRLPSGRAIYYFDPRIDEDGAVTYTGQIIGGTWGRISTYGGKLCVAEGTLVLTRRGWLAIERVLPHDTVWDGVEWVPQQGAVRQGRKAVIQAFGAWVTADHLVLTEGGWKRASQSGGHNRAACRLPDGVALSEIRRPSLSLAGALRLWSRRGDGSERAKKTSRTRHHRIVRLPSEPNDRRQTDPSRDEQTPGLRSVAKHARPLLAALTSSVAQLWRAGHYGVRSVDRMLREFLVGHGADLLRRLSDRTQEQLSRVLPRELLVGNTQRTGQQHALQSRSRHTLRADDADGPVRAHRVSQINGALSGSARGDGGCFVVAPRRVSEVFDLVNCGPRRRFVVLADGRPLIVHNCENAVQSIARDVLMHGVRTTVQQGSGYNIVLTVHDEVVCETPDSPEYNEQTLCKYLSASPPWCEDLPLAAAGYQSKFYRKD